jgi:hypothetical protein
VQCAALRATLTVGPARRGLVCARVCRLVHAEMPAPHPATRSPAVPCYDEAQPSSHTAWRVRCPACHIQFAFLFTAHVTQIALRAVQTFVVSPAEPVHAINKTLDFWRSLSPVSRAPQIDAPFDNVLSFPWYSFNAKMGPLHAAGFG